jgi:Cyclic nucleotide-binding domain
MRIESSVTAISWIPSDAVKGMPKIPFDVGMAHYDEPPPDTLDDIDELVARDAFREANELRAWIDVEDGRIVDSGYSGRGYIGVTRVKLGPREVSIPAVPLPTIQRDPEVGDDSARFVQTAGGRTGAPAPRRVRGKPFFRVSSAIAWTTLGLTIRADGSSEHELVGASSFPRHWIYDDSGNVVQKSGVIDFEKWYREAHGENTPWGDEDSPAVLTAAETALERELSRSIMSGGKSKPRTVDEGGTLVEQGQPGDELYVLLDGILTVEVDGEPVAEVGPGAILGERAALEGGTRTATLRAQTRCRVVGVPADQIDLADLDRVAAEHRREEATT